MVNKIKAAGFLLSVMLFLLIAPLNAIAADEGGYDETQLKDSACMVMETVIGICSDEASYEHISTMREADLNYILTSNGYPIEAEDFKSLLSSWKAAQEECGAFTQETDLEIILDQFVMAKETNGVSLSGEMVFAERPATVTLSFARDGTFKALTAGGKYTTGEILKKAGLNTVIGMGTVFAVLILISLLISTFKFIPEIQEKRAKKDKTAEKQSVGEVVPVQQNATVKVAELPGEPLRIPDGAVVNVTVRERPVIYVRVREEK